MFHARYVTRYGKVYVQEAQHMPPGAYDLGLRLVMSCAPTIQAMVETVYPGLTFDVAVPQPWFDKMNARDGKPPRAVWAYPDGSLFGKPLFLEDVETEYRRMVLRECSTWTEV